MKAITRVRATKPRVPKTKRAARPRTLAWITRSLRAHLPELTTHYHVKSLGIFGSYVRGEQKPRSDLDVLVEFEDNTHLTLLDLAGIEIHLCDLLGVKVDLVKNGHLKPYIGKRILREVIWLQKNGIPQSTKLPRRTLKRANRKNGKPNGGAMEPKREYLDFIQDMLTSMENAPQHIEGMTLEQMLADRKTRLAVEHELQLIGEAANRIPLEVRKRYPQIPWQQIISMRHKVVHGYDAIDYETIWDTLTHSIPRDQPLVATMLEKEKEQRDEKPSE